MKLSGIDDHIVAEHPDAIVLARHDAVDDGTPGNGPDLGDMECLAHFGVAQHLFLERRLEEAFHRRFDVVDDVIDDVVHPDINTFALGDFCRLGFRPDTESDDDGI